KLSRLNSIGPPRQGCRSKLNSFLGINQNSIVDDDDQVILSVAGHIDDDCFAWFWGIPAAASEGALLEDLPPAGGHEAMRRFESDEIKIAFGGFEENQVFAF